MRGRTPSEGRFVGTGSAHAALTIGSRALGASEPRQVRKEAALRTPSQVPRLRPIRAGDADTSGDTALDDGGRDRALRSRGDRSPRVRIRICTTLKASAVVATPLSSPTTRSPDPCRGCGSRAPFPRSKLTPGSTLESVYAAPRRCCGRRIGQPCRPRTLVTCTDAVVPLRARRRDGDRCTQRARCRLHGDCLEAPRLTP